MARATTAEILKLVPEWIDKYKNGANTKSLAREYKVSASTTYSYLKKAGVMRSTAESKRGASNPKWTSDKVGYRALHAWVNRNKPKPQECEKCKSQLPLDAANISQEYRRDLNDWKWLCRKCHMEEDGRLISNLKQYDYK